MTTATPMPTTLSLNEGYFAKRNWFDWAFAVVVVAGALFVFMRYHSAMDIYEKGILLGTVPSAIALAWFWRPLR
ncbi:MAG: c-type cytochrome biogenesis protein CcsB, partial [Rhodoferax sp.]|nr:c-type cytochrome biogenesis protein CcsB [Rhodoferax sp.]